MWAGNAAADVPVVPTLATKIMDRVNATNFFMELSLSSVVVEQTKDV
jgi:hypothetical protein